MKIKWFEEIEKPILGLAPMHQVSKSPLRILCRRAGADAVFSEMIAGEAVIRRIPQAFEMAQFSKQERPIIIQIFGANPESMARAARIIEDEIKPDGIDINFGCPVQKAAKQGFGSCQLKDPEAAAEIVCSIKKALKNTPLSAKMRIPSKDIEETINFVKSIYDAGVKLVSIHARTPTQKYRGLADWKHVYAVKEKFPSLYILGNGDIKSLKDLKEKIGNLDGVLVGRAAKINPQIFIELKSIKR
ncbi:tRNA dihydrouridine synthase DusB [Candidatus Berkelbacteria bacterium CG10_big_fil_rev_8_21_14_0_10_41_12]|uniref:tRNA dihydrouridine synthase DusB n=1 Tax=Candidatus Berkelbacteria bacterium CG10_big_fil_rev_8_21_14_0_10_41_12 TaxID=1974513 RepID=A0A2M6WWQ7_9BACT|nr:MAG: tRNA dihydrouridine synthase DusB [Candidatus Berkelbacteria bacterium CG10_big_fil_rev_8_21_14_0_10_41_12]